MKTAVYSSLTMPQRLRAMVCAFGPRITKNLNGSQILPRMDVAPCRR